MSSQNTFPGPNPGRQLARPTAQPGNAQPSWVNPQAQPQTGRPQQQPAYSWPDQQPAQGYPEYPQQGQQPQQQPYGQWSELQPSQGGYGQGNAPAGQPDPYAPQFEPYVPPSRPNFRQPQPNYPQVQPAAPAYGAQPQQPAQQWPAARPAGGYDAGGYGAQGYPAQAPAYGQQPYHENELSSSDWAGPHDSFSHDPYQQHGDPRLGFGQAEGGDLEPVYNEDELEYEDEEDAPRGRRGMLIVAALIGAIAIGGGMAYGYKKFAGTVIADGTPPVIKSDDSDAKTKPADAGGKQFPYTDSKVMGRLGDGTSTASADDSSQSQQSQQSDQSASDQSSTTTGSVDEGGARKVSTLVVGRDGTIMPPATPTQDQASVPPPSGGTAVPGTSLVDVFGQGGGGGGGPPSRPQSASSNDQPAPTKSKPIKIATINGAGASDDSSSDTPPPVKKKLKKVARAEPTVETDATADAPPVTQSSSSGTGFVAVLASVPHSASSRIDALKRFADMQQKYSTALAGKTPDIASANLSKGTYDRLVVGPPGSREQASAVCTQLKAEGYKGCWVTSY